MLRYLSICLVAAGILSNSACFAGETFDNPMLGFSIEKPDSWHFITAEENLENISRSEFKDENVKEMLMKYATAPVVAMMKHEEPYEDINPSLKLNVKPLNNFKANDPKAIVDAVISPMSRMFEEFEIVEGPNETELNGKPAGYVRINYTMTISDGTVFPICSELWIVTRDSYFFIIGAGTRQDEKTGRREEIRSILNTLAFK